MKSRLLSRLALVSTTAVAMAVVAGVVNVTTAAAQASVVWDNLVEPLAGTYAINDCGGENILLDRGEVLQRHLVVTNPHGDVHVVSHSSFSGVSGVGVTSGTRYHVVNPALTNWRVTSDGSSFSVHGTTRLMVISEGASGENDQYFMTFMLALKVSGEVIEKNIAMEVCRG